jgi:hypothetical protein
VFRIDEAEAEILGLDCDVLARRLPMVRMAKPFHPRAFIRMYIIESVTDAAWKREGENQVQPYVPKTKTEPQPKLF